MGCEDGLVDVKLNEIGMTVIVFEVEVVGIPMSFPQQQHELSVGELPEY